MSFKSTVFAAVAAAALAVPAFAEGIMVNDPYARASTMMAPEVFSTKARSGLSAHR